MCVLDDGGGDDDKDAYRTHAHVLRTNNNKQHVDSQRLPAGNAR